jgi:hypothetical protein
MMLQTLVKSQIRVFWPFGVERTFAWEDKFKRLLLRFERIQQRHYGMKLLGYTMINLRVFCGT